METHHYAWIGAAAVILIYLWLANHAMSRRMPEATKYAQEPWTEEEMRRTYEEAQKSPVDVRSFLPRKKSRRYIVVGGSGLVGGWIVQQLLLRGEDPLAIRILDLRPPTRPEVSDNNVHFLSADVTSLSSVTEAFAHPWPTSVSSLPLTVFHCVAFIGASDRHPSTLPIYARVNITGTAHVLSAAKDSGCDIFIATSSGSIALTPPTYFPLIPTLTPANFIQHLPNAEPVLHSLSSDLEDFGSCYAFSKARAEALVRAAHSPSSRFRTGCIRPSHAIYGFGVENTNSVSYDYLRRGGSPTWLWNVVGNFVDARNVAAGHLWFEDALLKEDEDGVEAEKKQGRRAGEDESVGGKAYAITDPNPPILYGHLYRILALLVHPSHPCRFPNISPLPILLIAHVVEGYNILRHDFGAVFGRILPALKGDLAAMQPAIFNMCTAHFIYDDEEGRKALGFEGGVGTLRGLVDAVVDFNRGVEARLTPKEKKEGVVEGGEGGLVPVPAVKM